MVVEFQVHAVVHFVVLKCDVILVDGVPLFQDDLVPPVQSKNKKIFMAVINTPRNGKQ